MDLNCFLIGTTEAHSCEATIILAAWGQQYQTGKWHGIGGSSKLFTVLTDNVGIYLLIGFHHIHSPQSRFYFIFYYLI